MNPPENRENIAEIFFETFNVPGLYIGVQAVFALMGCQKSLEDDKQHINKEQYEALSSLNGIVVDSGDGVTHVVPICDGYVLGSNIKHIPIAGRKITKFMEQMIRDRGEKIPTEDLYYATMELKEKHGYIAENDILTEIQKFDKKEETSNKDEFKQSKYFRTCKGNGKITNMPYKFDVGYEIFLGPECFFSPEIIDKNYKSGLDETIDLTIQQCPIDYRRKLYSNIVFSGGSTQFRNLDKRLKNTLQARVNNRLAKFKESDIKPKEINVNVTNRLATKHVVWLGGSTFSATNNFKNIIHTREEYMEKGPSCCRFNPVFGFS